MKKCPYCDFFSVTKASQSLKNEYSNSVVRELTIKQKYIGSKIDTIYFGGGSPLLLGTKNLKKIMNELSKKVHKKTEVTIELNPEHLELVHNARSSIRALGFNRVSIGIQTTDQDILKLIKRRLDQRSIKDHVQWFKDNHIDVSLDFMFGLPTQNLAKLKKDLLFIKSSMPQHVSFYMFTVSSDYEHYPLCPNDEEITKMFKLIHSELNKLGYEHYEVSNFAVPGKQSKHNSAYWEYKQYVGIGAGAHSFIKSKKTRCWNKNNIKDYIKDPGSPFGAEVIDQDQMITERIMLGLRLLKKGVRRDFVEQSSLPELISKKMIIEHKNNILIAPGSIPLMNEIIERLLPL